MADDPTILLTALRLRLAALDSAMDSGVLTVEDADTGRITYRSYPEMRQARADLLARMRDIELQQNPAVPRRTRHVVMVGRSGW